MKIISTTLAVCLLGMGCDAAVEDPTCEPGTLEDDIAYASPLTGPDIDATTGKLKPGNYVFSSTYLKLTSSEQGQQAFRDVMQGINAVLPVSAGLAAYRLATSDKCVSARTMSIWKDQTSMYGFVQTEAHLNAMKQIKIISRGGSGVTHWPDTEAGANFENAAQHVADEIRPRF